MNKVLIPSFIRIITSLALTLSGLFCNEPSLHSSTRSVDLKWLLNNYKACKVENSRIIISQKVSLGDRNLVLPDGIELHFTHQGALIGGKVKCDGLFLSGSPRIGSMLVGSISNEYFMASWFSFSSPSDNVLLLSNLFNSNDKISLFLDCDLLLDGTSTTVQHLNIQGDGAHAIKNACHFFLHGDLILKGCRFTGFKHKHEILFNFDSCETKSIRIDVTDCCFDGCHLVDRVFHSGVFTKSLQDDICIQGSEFSGINRFIIVFRNPCFGRFDNNTIHNCGTSEYNHVSMLWLGDELNDVHVHNWAITNNLFAEMIVPFSNQDDGREAHAILIYGDNIIIANNYIDAFYTAVSSSSRPGKDAEGIYIKGGYNRVMNNTLVNCIGSSPDGAITIKSSASNNIIEGNTIYHDAGIGIQCYTSDSTISGNSIHSCGESEAAICVFVNTGSIIANNTIQAEITNRFYKSALIVLNSRDIIISQNKINNVASLLTTYDCSGSIIIRDNEYSIRDLIFGDNTYYLSPIMVNNGEAIIRINKNIFSFSNCRASQIVFCGEKYSGAFAFNNNDITLDRQSVFSYVIRNRPNTFIGNVFHVKKETLANFKDYRSLILNNVIQFY